MVEAPKRLLNPEIVSLPCSMRSERLPCLKSRDRVVRTPTNIFIPRRLPAVRKHANVIITQLLFKSISSKRARAYLSFTAANFNYTFKEQSYFKLKITLLTFYTLYSLLGPCVVHKVVNVLFQVFFCLWCPSVVTKW